MLKNLLYLPLIISLAVSCNFRKSIKKDLTTGMTSRGDGLSCDDIYLTSDNEKINRNEFTFGEKIIINFNNVEGFTKTGQQAFPGMEMLLTNNAGDTLFYEPDLMEEVADPVTQEVLLLKGYLTIGNPIFSNAKESYKVKVHIWDKKGKGTFDSELEFTVKPNPAITSTTNGITYNEIYLYDPATKACLTSGLIPQSRDILIIYDGLKGFKTDANGLCNMGLLMEATDKTGRLILLEEDLLKDNPQPDPANSEEPFISTIAFTAGEKVQSPIHLKTVIWDKSGNGRIVTTMKLELAH